MLLRYKHTFLTFVVAHKPFGMPEGKALAEYEAMLHGELAQKVKEDRVEKFENPAILLGLKNDRIQGQGLNT